MIYSEALNHIICWLGLYSRDSTKTKVKDKSILKKQVIGVLKSGETSTLAEFVGTRWSLMDSQWSLQLKKKSNEDVHLFELMGCRMVVIYCLSLFAS